MERAMDGAKGETWDGQPISRDPPHGAVIVVYRARPRGVVKFLLLHRAHCGPAFAGDWAWGPPSGCRHPGEPVLRCAERELSEETGLRLGLRPLGDALTNWAVFLAAAPADARIHLSVEHDRWAWLPSEAALALVAPEVVRAQLRAAMIALGAGAAQGPDGRLHTTPPPPSTADDTRHRTDAAKGGHARTVTADEGSRR